MESILVPQSYLLTINYSFHLDNFIIPTWQLGCPRALVQLDVFHQAPRWKSETKLSILIHSGAYHLRHQTKIILRPGVTKGTNLRETFLSNLKFPRSKNMHFPKKSQLWLPQMKLILSPLTYGKLSVSQQIPPVRAHKAGRSNSVSTQTVWVAKNQQKKTQQENGK